MKIEKIQPCEEWPHGATAVLDAPLGPLVQELTAAFVGENVANIIIRWAQSISNATFNEFVTYEKATYAVSNDGKISLWLHRR